MSDMALLDSTGTYIQCLVIIYNENNLKKIFVTESFCCTPETAQYPKIATLQLKKACSSFQHS